MSVTQTQKQADYTSPALREPASPREGAREAIRYFICTCGGDADPHRRDEAERMRQQVAERIGNAEPLSLIDQVIYDLWWNWFAEIETVAVDQWCRVDVTVGFGDPAPLRLAIQCDRPTDGLLFAWKILADRQAAGLALPQLPDDDEDDE